MSDLPQFNMSLIERQRERLRPVFEGACGEPISPAEFALLLNNLRRALGVSRDVLTESLRHILGQTLTAADAFKLAWRFAGNLSRLKAGEPVRPWTTQHADEWVPLQITAAVPAKNRHGMVGTMFTFRVLAGSPCPTLLHTFWKPGFAGALSRRLGFTRTLDRYPYQRAVELVGLRLLGKLEAARSQRELQFFEVACPSGLLAWNRKHVLQYRARRPEALGCPQQFQHDCFRCAIGYLACPGGTHAQTYEAGLCPGCDQAEALFDADLSTEVCRECVIRARLST